MPPRKRTAALAASASDCTFDPRTARAPTLPVPRPTSSGSCAFCFFNDTATTEIYTLSLHDALPIFPRIHGPTAPEGQRGSVEGVLHRADRKSTRLNSSHLGISYAVFCLKKKKN